jgi:hypothetical protein
MLPSVPDMSLIPGKTCLLALDSLNFQKFNQSKEISSRNARFTAERTHHVKLKPL